MADLVATYNYDISRAMPTTGVTTGPECALAIVWTLVHQLTGDLNGFSQGVWTVGGSGGGVGSGTGGGMDGQNRWWNAGVFDKSRMTLGTQTANAWGAWIVLRAPSNFPATNRPSILLTRTPPTSGYTMDFRTYVTNGVYTGGDENDIPTTTSPQNTFSTTDYNWLLSLASGAETTVRDCHLVLATDGAFFWANSKEGSVRMWNSMGIFALLDPAPSDQNPWTMFRGGPSWGDPSPAWPSTTYTAGYSGWSCARLAKGPFAYTGSGMSTFSITGTASSSALPIFSMIGAGSDASAIASAPRYMGIDVPRSLYPEFPVWVADTTASLRGRVRDLWMTSSFAEGTVDPSGADPIVRSVWGDFLVPCNQQINF